MKLFDFGPAANARRVTIFLKEKGLELETVTPDLRSGALHQEPYKSMNPFSCVPFLELDDGTVISESIAICRYIEEMHPEPSLMGRDATERAVAEMWNRRVEIDGFVPMIHSLRNGEDTYSGRVLPGTKNDLPREPVIVERGKASLEILHERLDPQLADNPFIAGDLFTVADITHFMTMGIADRLGVPISDSCLNVKRWLADVSARPSVQD